MKKLKFPKIVSDFQNRERIILRDFLALERTTLANERTLFAYIRTSLYLILGGIGLVQLKDFENIRWIGYFSFGLSATLIVFGLVRFYKLRKKLQKYYDEDDIKKMESDKEKEKEEKEKIAELEKEDK
jgi:putative membrane protein